MRTIRLLGGPCNGQTFKVDKPRDAIESAYAEGSPVSGHPWDQTFGRATYLARQFAQQEQESRREVHWRTWRAYLWSELPADETTAARYRDEVTQMPVDDEGWREATPGEVARWDAEHANMQHVFADGALTVGLCGTPSSYPQDTSLPWCPQCRSQQRRTLGLDR